MAEVKTGKLITTPGYVTARCSNPRMLYPNL